MPLPPMAGDDGVLIGSPGLSTGIPSAEPTPAPVDPREQVKGAMQVVSQLRQSNKEQLEGLATQFPSISKPAKELLQGFDKALQGLVRELIKTVQMPEAPAPQVVR